ncbi:hypothetical protein GYMLUDRAFT_228416 [Collybiopsis luxurians FD-317 M1]|uniref:Uncharacterized protein n=1 Tax=Collybiopsis luxurians FD-317 M1 TaxID=944289 RepID=A0A0D0C6J3_9AGAR|nr:hypothetical protein GYMLUDRAFT_228416 [Collybiopsis luxurians FD-317 M1]
MYSVWVGLVEHPVILHFFQLAAIYRMDTQLVDVDPYCSVQIIRRIDTHVPTPLLSAHIAASSTPWAWGIRQPSEMVFMPLLFLLLLLMDLDL